jgi:DNA-binding CsgD family transcriptional regulator
MERSDVGPVVHKVLQRFNLSRRETEATVLLAQGLRAKQIAEQMSCSEKTVYAHLARVCKKANCRDYHEVICTLLAFACRSDLPTS